MKVLLTGGAGYIGSHTAVELLKNRHEVIIADNFSNSDPEVLVRLREITGQEILFYQIDVTNRNEIDKLFQEQTIDAVVHFAGFKAVGESVKMPVEYYRNNLNSTLVLLEIMHKYGVHRFVFSSSATVYGDPQKLPLTENMPTGCTNPYGWTKWMNEQILTDAAKAIPELTVIILRYFNPIAAHESGRIGENPNGVPNNLMPYITQVAAGKLPRLNVFGGDYPTKDGTGIRDYIHVTDLAKGHVAAIDFAARNRGVEIFNLGTGEGYSVLEIIQTFEKVNGVKIPFSIVERRPGDIATCYADPGKAAEILYWKTEKGLAEMCRDSWNWQKKNPGGFRK